VPDYLRVREMRLPRSVKDPAELTEKQFHQLFGVA